MNRKKRRQVIRKTKAQKFTLEEIQRALQIAANMRVATQGHLYQKIMKDAKVVDAKCVFCSASLKTKKECKYWMLTYVDRFQSILVNPTFYSTDDKDALWFLHGEEYKNIKLPYIAPKL